MQYFKALLVGAFAAVAVAQQQTGTIQINAQTVPKVVTAGVPVPIGYSGGDPSAPVTITLRKGPSDNLATLNDLTTTATGGTFNWNPDKSLVDGNDYALTITQGPSQVNFYGPFSITGGASASASASSASVSASISSSAAASASSVVSSSAAALVSSIIQSYNASIASANSTIAALTNATTTAPAFVANTAPTGTGALTSTGNTTLSLATLTSLTSQSTSGSATSTSGSSGTSRGSTAQTSAPASSASGLASPLGFVLSALAAALYLY
ncbi:MAG: hypothetical protein M1835_000156 [Candelina submexicana]|nr:MAG: hypothetical protein M1835_000156 [Candelina submexicana]